MKNKIIEKLRNIEKECINKYLKELCREGYSSGHLF